MDLKVWPYVHGENGWSIPDELWLYCFKEAESEERLKDVFWGGSVTDFYQFLYFLKQPEQHPLMVIDMGDGKPRAFAWLNGVEGNHALAHFCVLGPWSRSIGKTIMDYWKSFGVIKVLLGFTPASNDKAIKVVQQVGFTVLGEIPQLCNMAYECRTVPGVVTYCELGGNGHG